MLFVSRSRRLLEEVKKHLTHFDVHVKGINGSISALNDLNCNLTIGSPNSPAFKGIGVLITSTITPVLIGQNILGHSTLDAYVNNNQDTTIEFRRTFTSGPTTQTTSSTRNSDPQP